LLLITASAGSNLVGCGGGGGGSDGPGLGERVIPLGQPVPKGGGRYAVGEAYQINGVWYKPSEEARYDRIGTASWYGELFHGRRTANGEIYDMDRLSAASPTLPMPVYARVTNLGNGRSIIVRVNDRGPYRSNRIMDLSRRSAELLGYREKGTAQVRVQYLGRAPISGDDSYERRHLASQSWARYAMRGQPVPRAAEPVTVASIDQPRPSAKPPRQRVAQAIDPLVAEEERDYARPEPAPPPPRDIGQAQPRSVPVRTVPIRASSMPAPVAAAPGRGTGLVVLAGSFKSKDNADRARNVLGEIGRVDVAPMSIGGETFFRVRVGPFADQDEAGAALSRVTEAGYAGARLVMK
jgi:rare lipoprotein A